MNIIKLISCCMVAVMGLGCATTQPTGSKGPKVVASGKSTESEKYGEVGVKFTSTGDFFALFSPKRWGSPIATGGSLSWLNPNAWSEDAGRTSRILIGEVVVVGGVAVAAGHRRVGAAGSVGGAAGHRRTLAAGGVVIARNDPGKA